MLEIGKLQLASPVMLAPMSGISSLPFRKLNRSFGCKFAFTEMIDTRSLAYSNRKSFEMLRSDHDDVPLGIQLVGGDEHSISNSLEKINNFKYDILDFNAACPCRKVTGKKGAGAALLKDPEKLRDILKILVARSKVPVTVKIRLGWSDNRSCCDIARYAEDSGIKAIFVHGRTKVQGYSGKVDYESIARIKSILKIPVIASGDILSCELMKKMFDQTRCDGVLVARGALGNPWIFKETNEFLKSGKIISRPDMEDIITTMKRHLELCAGFYGEKFGVIRFRSFFIWYTCGFHSIRPLRAKAMKAVAKKDMAELIDKLRDGEFKRDRKVYRGVSVCEA